MDRFSSLETKSDASAMAQNARSTDVSPNRSAPHFVDTSMDPHSSESIAEPRFPGEDAGQSLAEMARADFDATLQLLAERAQHLTGASGAAIALRRDERPVLLCRASAGLNAPELGAQLSMENGLSGESMRTRLAVHCKDAENDSRVNRENCCKLGIASIIAMPILVDDQVLGVFELFSDKAMLLPKGPLCLATIE